MLSYSFKFSIKISCYSLGNSSRSYFGALCKLMVRLAADSTMCFSKKIDYRKISQRNRAFLVDTLELVRGLEAQGVPSKQAETITDAITKVINDSLEDVARSAEMQKMAQESNLSKFKSEVRSMQADHFSLLQRQTEKHLPLLQLETEQHQSHIDKIRIELSRIRDELANQKSETANLVDELDREICALRAQVELAKSDAIIYGIASVVTISLAGLAIIKTLARKP